MPCKNKLDVLYFVVASFTWLLRAKQEPFLPTHQNHNNFSSSMCCFNLQQGPGVATLDSTKVGETDTRQPPVCEARRWNQSRVSVRVMSVRAASSNNTAEPKYDLYRPQLTCVLLVHITSMHKPGSDATVGERSHFKKIRTHTQDPSR